MRVTTAFKRLLCLSGITVSEVDFQPASVVVTVKLRSRTLRCPLCVCTTKAAYDKRPVFSSWRHLDLAAWRLEVRAELRRLQCPSHGVRTQGVPFARPGSRFTRDFEDLVGWLATTMDKTALRRLVRVDWDTTGRIIERVMQTGLDPNRLDDLFVIGVDEVSWRKGHCYLTMVSNNRTGKFVWGHPGKDTATLDGFFTELGKERSGAIEAVSMDMGPAYDKSVRKKGHATNAIICYDPFHVVQLATNALDKVRRQGLAGTAAAPRQGRRPPVQGRPLGLAEEPDRPDRRAGHHPAQAQAQGRPAVAGVRPEGSPSRGVRRGPVRRRGRDASGPVLLQGLA